MKWSIRETRRLKEEYAKGTPGKDLEILFSRSAATIAMKAQREGFLFRGHSKKLPKSYINNLPLTDDQFRILLGSMLGDGHIQQVGRFTETHAAKERAYARWKMRELGSLFTDKSEERSKLEPKLRSGFYRIQTRRFPFLKKWREIWYPNGKKIIPPEFVRKLEPLGLAVWFQDDGTRHKRSDCFYLATYDFTFKENKYLARILREKFDIKVVPGVQKKYPVLYIPRKHNNARKFQKIVLPWIHPSMLDRKIFRRWTDEEELEEIRLKNFPDVISIPPPKPEENPAQKKLDKWMNRLF